LKPKTPADPLFNKLRTFYRRFDSGIWTVTSINLILAIGSSISIPFIALYLHQDRGLSMTSVGLILLLGGVASALAQVTGGELSDRLGRRPVFIFSTITRALMFGLAAFVMAIGAPVWLIALAYILGQAIGMVNMALTSAIVADLTPKKLLTEAYGVQRVGVNLGWAAGPAVGGYLAFSLDYHWLFAAAAVITLFSLPIIFLLFRESFSRRLEKAKFKEVLSIAKNRSFLAFIIISFLIFLAMGQMLSTLSVFTVDRVGLTAAQYGFLLTTNGILVILFQYPITRILGRLPLIRMLVGGGLLYTIGYLMFGWLGGFALAVIAMIIITAGEIVFSPAALSIVGQLSPPQNRGRYMGFFGLGQTLGWMAAPLFGGILLDAFPAEPMAIWGTISAIALIAAAGFYVWSKKVDLAD
jgi:MFS family permease